MRKQVATQRRARHESQGSHRHGPNDFLGLDAKNMSPKAQVLLALAAGVPVAVMAGLADPASPIDWVLFASLWLMLLPLGLLINGLRGLFVGRKKRTKPSSANYGERELLEALREHGGLTPARAAMETSLAVAEADGMLKRLAEGGHLDVRVRGGGIFYALWGPGAGR